MSKIESVTETITDSKKLYFKVIADGLTYSAWEYDGTGKPVKAFKQLMSKEFKIGDNVKFNYSENGKFKNLVSIEKSVCTGNEPSPSSTTKTTNFGGGVNSTFSKGNMTDDEYRAYQIKMFEECFEDAGKFVTHVFPEPQKVDIAIAFFEKRNSPRIYAKKEDK